MGEDGFWVFGYGSLMWRPGFDYAERRMARLPGFRRAFCMTSIRYRGTPERPGLVLALDPADGAECRGVAFRVEAALAAPVLAYLRDRELVTDAYLETRQRIAFDAGGEAQALAFVVDHAHPQYAGDLSHAEQAAIIREAVGPAGPNAEYLHNTVAHLRELGVRDPELETLDALVRAAETAGEPR